MNGEQAPKKRNRKKLLIILAALFVVAAIIYGISSANKKKTETPVETVKETATKEVSTPAPAPTWQTVIDVTASTDKRTETFYLGSGRKKLLYNVTTGTSFICAVYIVEEGRSLEKGGGLPEVMVENPGPGETVLVKDPGNYYLDVTSANCSWQVTIQELK